MVWQREALGYTYSDIAQKLCVDKSTEFRTVNLFHTTGSVAKKPYPEGRAFCKLTSPAQLLILHLTDLGPTCVRYSMSCCQCSR